MPHAPVGAKKEIKKKVTLTSRRTSSRAIKPVYNVTEIR
jgi:hypothetical protein